jgi:hypothetical protein
MVLDGGQLAADDVILPVECPSDAGCGPADLADQWVKT